MQNVIFAIDMSPCSFLFLTECCRCKLCKHNLVHYTVSDLSEMLPDYSGDDLAMRCRSFPALNRILRR